jgi:hypothetical protein
MRTHHPLLVACVEMGARLVAEGDEVGEAAPGVLAPVLSVPEFFEQAENKNAPAAKRSGRVEGIRFFIGVPLESLILG